MSVKDSMHEAALNYPGGITALATRFKGLQPQTLRNMLNPNSDSHPWSLIRFQQFLAYTGATGPLQELCAENGGMFVPTGKYDGLGLPDLFPLMAKLTAELGDVSREVSSGASDGRISVADYNRISAALSDVFEVGAALRAATQRAAGPALRMGGES